MLGEVFYKALFRLVFVVLTRKRLPVHRLHTEKGDILSIDRRKKLTLPHKEEMSIYLK